MTEVTRRSFLAGAAKAAAALSLFGFVLHASEGAEDPAAAEGEDSGDTHEHKMAEGSVTEESLANDAHHQASRNNCKDSVKDGGEAKDDAAREYTQLLEDAYQNYLDRVEMFGRFNKISRDA